MAVRPDSPTDLAEQSLDAAIGGALEYKLDRALVKSWSISGDADDRPTEEVAFAYNKIAAGYATTTDGKE